MLNSSSEEHIIPTRIMHKNNINMTTARKSASVKKKKCNKINMDRVLVYYKHFVEKYS